MIDFLQTTEFVLTMTAAYLLIGLGWNVVYNTCGYLNFAIGQFYILGAILSFRFQSSWGIDSPWLAGLLAVISAGVIAFVAERLVLRPLASLGLDERGLAPLILTIGLGLILVQVSFKLSPSTVTRPQELLPGTIDVGGVLIAKQSLLMWFATAVVAGALFMFFRRTDMGRAMRAAAVSPSAARALGLRVASFRTLAFTLSGLLAGFAGFLIAPTQGIAYNGGDVIAIYSFMAVSIVGLGRDGMAVVGAVVVASIQGYSARYLGQSVSEVIVLVAFLGVVYLYAARADGGILPTRLRVAMRPTPTESVR
ncbi:branched-chain amino acid ABC transporter permease [Rhodococcus sp. IEGM 1381]|uniref:branched-chain amino acid ABC transporter permease n=1 Tax=Rhodococcus sp. IEGM 1381 TaxID=3047085 RepID=UPI0024B81568|nr:branched-chain amino acid ABC transporter permease [Rhodococcus sp. IEGM 1381]MDI9897415.1 branched-chain amino acid ABC transporter permease [Rhodococcus sp. IEGM 1381]